MFWLEAVLSWMLMGNFPPSFSSFDKYLSSNLMRIRDIKTKLDMVPALKLLWRKQAGRNSVIKLECSRSKCCKSCLRSLKVFPPWERCLDWHLKTVSQMQRWGRRGRIFLVDRIVFLKNRKWLVRLELRLWETGFWRERWTGSLFSVLCKPRWDR